LSTTGGPTSCGSSSASASRSRRPHERPGGPAHWPGGGAERAVRCFPETYIPGLRGLDFDVPPRDQRRQEWALEQVRAAAERHHVAFVISRDGKVEGYQAKNQIPVEEEESATTLIGPKGECVAYVPYGQEQLLVHDLDLSRATGFCAKRYKPEFYPA
jgi:hypothetical protein